MTLHNSVLVYSFSVYKYFTLNFLQEGMSKYYRPRVGDYLANFITKFLVDYLPGKGICGIPAGTNNGILAGYLTSWGWCGGSAV